MAKYTDEQLTAFIDGELPQAQLQAIDRAIKNDPELSVRVAALHMDTGGLKSIFDSWLGKAPREKLREMMPALIAEDANSSKTVIVKRQWGLLVLSALTALAIGFWAGRNSVELPQGSTDWVEAVAEAQAVNPPVAAESAEYEKAAALVTQLGVPITHEQLRLTGLTLQSSDKLLMNNYNLVQLRYVDKQNRTVGIYMLRTGAVQSQQMLITPASLYGLFWAHRGVEIAVLGEADPNMLKSVADQLDRALIQ